MKLPKKRNLSECGHYRGTMNLSALGKVPNMILLQIMGTDVYKKLGDMQAGFSKERSCDDQIVALKQSLDWYMEFTLPIYVTFIDFERISTDHIGASCGR